MSKTDSKLLSLLGLATKAGKLASGEFQTETAVKDGSAKLVLVAEDASENTKKLFKDKCSYYRVPVYIVGTKEALGAAIGKEYRASVAVLEEGFAKAIQKKMNEQMSQGDNGGK